MQALKHGQVFGAADPESLQAPVGDNIGAAAPKVKSPGAGAGAPKGEPAAADTKDENVECQNSSCNAEDGNCRTEESYGQSK